MTLPALYWRKCLSNGALLGDPNNGWKQDDLEHQKISNSIKALRLRHYTIFFLVEDVFLGGVEAGGVLLDRTDSTVTSGRDLPLIERTPCSSEFVMGGFLRGLAGAVPREDPLTLIGLWIRGNGSVTLVLLLRGTVPKESAFNPTVSIRRGLLPLISDLLLCGIFILWSESLLLCSYSSFVLGWRGVWNKSGNSKIEMLQISVRTIYLSVDASVKSYQT